MNIRTPDDLCLLCLANKADKKGSHFTPAGISKKVIGERDKEEMYTIDAAAHTITDFMGRGNLKNEDPTIKKGEHVEDYIFCTDCEKKLGVIESECNQPLNLLVEAIAQGSASIQRTSQGNKYASLPKPDKNVLLLYLYSIMWRQCLRQQLDLGTIIVSIPVQEVLRKIVYKGINQPVKEIKASTDYASYPFVQLLTSYHKGDVSTNMINPHPQRTNPYLFFIGPYDALLYHDTAISADFTAQTGLPIAVIDSQLIINTATMAPVGIVNETTWNSKVKHLMEYEATLHNYEIYRKLAAARHIPINYAKLLISKEAATFQAQYPHDYSKCMNLALDKLLRQ